MNINTPTTKLLGVALAVVGGITAVIVMRPAPAVVDVADCGALPNDEVDDGACVRSVIAGLCNAGGGTVRFKSGLYLFANDPGPGILYNAPIRVECSDIKLQGQGFSTVLALNGDMGASTVNLVRVTAHPVTKEPTENFEISDMTLSTDLATNTEEQTHAITLTGLYGPVSGASIHHLRIRNKWRPEERAGDCVRMVGVTGTGPVTLVNISNNIFDECDRAGVSVQRAVMGVHIINNLFKKIGATALDFEPTGNPGSGSDMQFVINNNIFTEKGVSLAGQPDPDMTLDVTFNGNTVHGRVGIFNARRLVATGNTIEYLAKDSDGALNIRASDDIVVTGNTIQRLPVDGAPVTQGPVARIHGSNGRFSRSVILSNNAIVQRTEGHAVEVESTMDAQVIGNGIEFFGPTGGKWSGIMARASGQDIDKLQLNMNRMYGPFAYAVTVAGGPLLVGRVQVVGNQSSGAGLRCENPTKFTKPIVHASYDYGGAATSGCTGVQLVQQSP